VHAGRGADVDLLIGTNREEANLYTVPSGAPMTETRLLALAERRLADPREALTAYRTAQPAAHPAELASRLITDTFTRGSRLLAEAHAHARHRRTRTFAYEFAWRSPAFGGALGACHCVELPFVLHLTDLPALYGDTALLGPRRPPPGLDRVHPRRRPGPAPVRPRGATRVERRRFSPRPV
jgi:para-nitrobenzyl esterase